MEKSNRISFLPPMPETGSMQFPDGEFTPPLDAREIGDLFATTHEQRLLELGAIVAEDSAN